MVMFALTGFFCVSVARVVASNAHCSDGRHCVGAASASMLQTQSLESHASAVVTQAFASQSANATANRKALIKTMMKARRRQDIEEIKETIMNAAQTGLRLKTEFENSDLWKWVQDFKTSPIYDVKNWTEAEAAKFWVEIQKALDDPVGTIKKLIGQWVPGLKAIMEDVHQTLKEASIERFFNGQAIAKFNVMDILNLFMSKASIDGVSKPGYERYLDAIVHITQEGEVAEIVGQILEGAMGLVKEVQDAALKLVSKGLAAADAVVDEVALGPIGDAIKMFAKQIGDDGAKLDEGKAFWEGMLSDWVEAKTDLEEWLASLSPLDYIQKTKDLLKGPAKAVAITVGWNSIAMLVGCEGCYEIKGSCMSLMQVSNQSDMHSGLCDDLLNTRLKCNDGSKPAVSTSINEEAGALDGKIGEVKLQVEAWSLKDTSSSSVTWVTDFIAGMKTVEP